MPAHEDTNAPCPHLPEAAESMSYRDLRRFRGNEGPEFYVTALRYAQYLWQRNEAARAILAFDRAILAAGAWTPPDAPAPFMPYPALAWMLREHDREAFIGNPRAHYQHLADRVRGPGSERKAARAWACWHIVRRVRPEFERDPRHDVDPPTREATRGRLDRLGCPGEAERWAEALEGGPEETASP